MSRATVIRQLVQQLMEYAEEQDTGKASELSDALTEMFMRGEISITWNPECGALQIGATERAVKTAIKLAEEASGK